MQFMKTLAVILSAFLAISTVTHPASPSKPSSSGCITVTSEKSDPSSCDTDATCSDTINNNSEKNCDKITEDKYNTVSNSNNIKCNTKSTGDNDVKLPAECPPKNTEYTSANTERTSANTECTDKNLNSVSENSHNIIQQFKDAINNIRNNKTTNNFSKCPYANNNEIINSNSPAVETPSQDNPKTNSDETADQSHSLPQPSDNDATDNSTVSENEKAVVDLVNEIRKQYGLSPLKLNPNLSAVARTKSNDMKENKYFSHTSPTYGSPFEMMKKFGIEYKTAGENIAMGYTSPKAVMDGWMNSSGHRANILNASFTEIGVGYIANGHYWTQMFIG